MRRASSLIEWGVAALAIAGERESGDLHLVKAVGRGVLVSVVDGLGHGAEAAAAARTAVATLNRHADDALLPLLRRCHTALHGTRGVVMSLALFEAPRGSLTWLGVGNVEGLLLHADPAARPTSLVTRGGIVGSALPPSRAEVVAVAPGDTLIFATDGIQDGFAREVSADASPQQLADQILARYTKGTDDALVLVARRLGAAR
ncbi:MAG TPA: SpoIIE family protein phosphatase [Gemmatimonadales bacterium]|nr:SpoIIE family protein phosphatase [Gemmatimonadales bacterium]